MHRWRESQREEFDGLAGCLQNFLFTFHTLRLASRFIRDWVLASALALGKQTAASIKHRESTIISEVCKAFWERCTCSFCSMSITQKTQKNIQKISTYRGSGCSCGEAARQATAKRYWVGFDAEIHVTLQLDTSFLRYDWLPADEGSYAVSSVSLFWGITTCFCCGFLYD